MKTTLEILAEDRPQLVASVNGAHIDDNTKDDRLAELILATFVSRDDRIGQAVEPISFKVTGQDEILQRLEQHFDGGIRIGLYNLLADGTVRWAVTEFEAHGPGKVDQPWEAAKQYQAKLKKLGITAYVERSKSFDSENYHAWIFFEAGIEALRVHRTLKALLKATGLNPACEVFPKGNAGFGNFVWAPFFGGNEDYFDGKRGGGVSNGRTVFVDNNGVPILDQTEFLTGIRAVSPAEFGQLERAMLPHMESAQDKRASGRGTFKQLQRVLDNCPFIKWCEANARDLPEPLWYAMISNLSRFEGGKEVIHRISALDATPDRYSVAGTDDKINQALEASGPITYATIKTLGWDGDIPSWPRSPAGFGAYADLDKVLEELMAMKGTDKFQALRLHFDEDFHELPVSRQATWLMTLATNLGISANELKAMARSSFSRLDISGRALRDLLVRLSELGGSPEEKGKLVYEWFVKNGGLVYRDREHHGYWIWQGTVYEVGNNQPFYTYIWGLAEVTNEGPESKKIWAVLKAETDSKGTFLNSFTWLHTNASKNVIYLHLNLLNERIVRVDEAGVKLVDNGANEDSVLLAPASKMLPIEMTPLDEAGYQKALRTFDELVLRNMACSRDNQLLYGCWALTYPLVDYVKVRPHLRCEGATKGGKSRAMDLISHFVYGDDVKKKGTDAANYTDAARNPLSLFDQIEVANFGQAFGDFILTVVTGITKEKRQLGTDRETVLERARCLVNTTGIENLGKTEHINRTFAIICDRWKNGSAGWSERVYARITDERPRLMYAHLMLISRVLKKIAAGRMEWWQDYLEQNHANHEKDRSNSFISLMALILEEILGVIDPIRKPEEVVSAWIQTQDADGQEVTVASHPIISLLNAIVEDAKAAGFNKADKFMNWGYEVECQKRSITGTASQLHNTFTAVKKRKPVTYDYKNSLQLSRRISDLVRSLQKDLDGDTGEASDNKVKVYELDAFTLTTKENRAGSLVYTFEMPDDGD